MANKIKTDTTDRYITLDALRGFAVMGILAMNIIAFAMPEWAYITPQAYGGATLADRLTWFMSFVFIDGKMRGLFSMLFGASMMLIIDRAQAKHENPVKIHYARMAWLAVIGLVHYYFIWFGDILFLYAVVGSFAYLFRQWEPKKLISTALIIMIVGTLLWGIQFGGLQLLQMISQSPGANAELVKEYKAAMASADFNYNIADDLSLHRGSYWPIAAEKLNDLWSPLTSVLQSIAETLPLMMFGMALQKNGFLTGKLERTHYIYWAMRLLPAGLMASLALAFWVVATNYDRVTTLAVFMVWSTLPHLMLTVGYAAGCILIVQTFSASPIMARMAAVGQTALTNYLGTSTIMTFLFYGYGLGLYGHISRFGLIPFVLSAWVTMAIWSKPWLDNFRYGPMEWAWRSLARGALQPMRRL
jgi:uncharacterized protein